MSKIPTPRSTEAAAELLDQIARLQGELASINTNRNAAIAATNAAADAIAAPVIAELDQLRAPIEAWFAKAAPKLLVKDRKSVELGGCMVGHRLGNKSVTFAHGDDKAALAALDEHRWAKPYIRITTAVDKTAVRKGLEGKHAAGLIELGFGVTQPESFFIERVAQGGTITS